MATIKLSAWDIAESLGLTYKGEWPDEDKCYYAYKFEFHGKEIVDGSWHEREEDAKEAVAEGLLLDIGKKLAGMI